jgi:hypothetical protein
MNHAHRTCISFPAESQFVLHLCMFASIELRQLHPNSYEQQVQQRLPMSLLIEPSARPREH